MLNRLEIQNYALIDHLNLDFSHGFTAITGETGAGKSILLGAIGLLIGDRADHQVLLNSEKKCIVEGHFNISALKLEPFFEEYNLDFDNVLIIRREIIPGGKSRAFINDTPVVLSTLKELGNNLLNIHSQHETLSLGSGHFQLQILDSFAKLEDEILEYRKQFYIYQGHIRKLEEEKKKQQNSNAEFDYWQYQLRELTETNITDQESEHLEQELLWIENSESALNKMQEAIQIIHQDDTCMEDQLNFLINSLQQIKGREEITDIITQLRGALAELKDAAISLQRMVNNTDTSLEKREIIRARLDTLNRLMVKHKVNSSDELIRVKNYFDERISSSEKRFSDISEMEDKLSIEKSILQKKAEKISVKRQFAAKDLSTQIINLLSDLGMPSAKVELVLLKEEEISENGFDKLRFLFSANKGGLPMEIGKIASGGELSRLMLALKSLLANKATMPTIIFDEIDSGISGATAAKTALVLKSMGKERQIFAITHLPQIAAKADHQIFVEKIETETSTFSHFRILEEKERAHNIAVMLSNDKVTESALTTAQNLISQQ